MRSRSGSRFNASFSASFPGPGPFLNMLELISGKKAEMFGKPGPMMVREFLKDEHNLDLNRTVFVGDT